MQRSKFKSGMKVARKGGIFYAIDIREIMLMQHRVGYGITTPRSSDLKPEQRVVLHIFICSKIKL